MAHTHHPSVLEQIKSVGVAYSHTDTIFDGVDKKNITRWTVLLPGAGCQWARKPHKGCSFCAFNAMIDEITGGRLIPNGEMMEFFESAAQHLKGVRPDLLSLFNGGSFINDKEIVPGAQLKMLEWVAAHEPLQRVLFETRTEYLSAKKLEACLKAIGPKKMRIALGLETQDDLLREKVINKGMSKVAFERAIKRLHSYGIEVQTYVFMKPYTLSEKEAIEEAVQTIEYAVNCGCDIVMLEAAMAQRGTAFEEAFNRGEFKSPWLWSIREVVERTRQYVQLNVGLFTEDPAPVSYPRNCDACSDRFNAAFDKFRQTHDFSDLNRIDCTCKASWLSVLQSEKKVARAREQHG